MISELPERFIGEVEKITIESYPYFFLCPPEVGTETEQKLTINSSGKVIFTSKEYTVPNSNAISSGKWKEAALQKDAVNELLETIIEPFRKPKIDCFCTDVGNWVMTAFNKDGEQFKYEGCLYPDSFEKAEEISYYIRSILMMPKLYLFDGGRGIEPRETYIYLSVEFSQGGKTYYYLTENTTIDVGDTVIVPVGNNGDEKIVSVVDVEEFTEDELPMPLDRVKSIIGKFEKTEKIVCPLNNKKLTFDECYLIEMCAEGLGPKSGYPEIIDAEIVKENSDVCLKCRYHSPDITRSVSRKDAIKAHKYSSNNKPALLNDNKCGCFYCLKIFDPKEITEYLTTDNDCDRLGTAICPYCGIDSVIGESSGYPITKDFLLKMYKIWFDSGSGFALHTPFGFVRLLLDDREVSFRQRSVDIQSEYPDVDGCHYITYEFKPDGKKHKLKFAKDNISANGDIATDELLETISFEENNGIITLGCKASFGDTEDYKLDYDGTYNKDGFEIIINSKTTAQTFEFSVAWIENLDGKDENQAWLAADPFELKKKL